MCIVESAELQPQERAPELEDLVEQALVYLGFCRFLGNTPDLDCPRLVALREALQPVRH